MNKKLNYSSLVKIVLFFSLLLIFLLFFNTNSYAANVTVKLKVNASYSQFNSNVTKKSYVSSLNSTKDTLTLSVPKGKKITISTYSSCLTTKNYKYSLKGFYNNDTKYTTYTAKSNITLTAKYSEKGFEKAIKGSSGWAAATLNVYKKPSTSATVLKTIKPGTGFTFVSYESGFFKIITGSTVGYVKKGYVMINLPDVVPSIEYEITNAYSSIYLSSGYKLPNVTKKPLYKLSSTSVKDHQGKVFNKKLNKYEYLVPVVYSTALKIAKAQYSAQNNGYSLKIYDSYRPYSVSTTIRDSLNSLYSSNSTVRKGIDSWGKGWFLAQSVSAHNTGTAIDVTLVNKTTRKEIAMPSAMHELSTKAIKYNSGSCSSASKKTTVKTSDYAKTMNSAAKKLDKYFTDVGMSTLASEWWHFQEQDAYKRIKDFQPNGCNFFPTTSYSKTLAQVDSLLK